jgi:hypothetical protein
MGTKKIKENRESEKQKNNLSLKVLRMKKIRRNGAKVILVNIPRQIRNDKNEITKNLCIFLSLIKYMKLRLKRKLEMENKKDSGLTLKRN